MDESHPHIHAFIPSMDEGGDPSHKKYFSSSHKLQKLHQFHEVAIDLHGVILSPQEIKDLPVQGYTCGMNGWCLSEVELQAAGIVRGHTDLICLIASAEVRFRLSGPWYGAAFADAGAVSSERAENCAEPFFEDPNRTRNVPVQCGFRDTGRIRLRQFKVGAGPGLRYDMSIGYIHLDVAAKLNPDPLDLQLSEDALAAAGGSQDDSRNTWYRFNVHFSIGQAF